MKVPGKSRRNQIKEIGRSLILAMEQIAIPEKSDDFVLSQLKVVRELLSKNGFELMVTTFIPEKIDTKNRKQANKFIFSLLEGLNENLLEKFDTKLLTETFLETIKVALKAQGTEASAEVHKKKLVELSEQTIEAYRIRSAIDLSKVSKLIE